ncbi:hypothetical protein [Comamonas thiooxydans]|uniref:hypothetical protein n=1 Tax=Comamonas thiooxydans TaxID=363952 RepID=UPI000B40C6DB|nr:hypothetical protein [Comamonas thiooxydans]
MAWYRTGTVAVTNNSNIVTGTGTSWVDGAAIGETFLGPDAQVYEITSIVSGTSLRISPNYKGGTATAQAYAIMPTQGYLRDLAAQAAALVNSYQAVRDGAGAGKFAAGTAAAPSVRGAADENTGLNLPGGDVLQLVTGGVAHLQIGPDGTPSGNAVTKAPVSTAQQDAINAVATASVPIATVGSDPAQVPPVQFFGRLAFLDVLGALMVSKHQPAANGSFWTERVSDTSIKLFLRGDDGIARSTTLTLS